MNQELIVILQAIKTKACKSEWNEQALAARTYTVLPTSKLRCGDIVQKYVCLKDTDIGAKKVTCQNCPMSSYTFYAHMLIMRVIPYE